MAKADSARLERPKLGADGIRELLRLRYPDKRFALFDEVRNKAGFDANRSADCIAIALWPSDGLRITGIEIKTSRHDYLRELEKPEKADAIAGYCDLWYLAVEQGVIPDLTVVPERWGVLQVTEKGDGLREIKAAVLNTSPRPLDRSFVAAVCKRAQESAAPRAQIKEAEKKGREHGQWQLKRAEEERDKIKKQLDEFENSSGLKIGGWHGGALVGEAVAAVLRARDSQKYQLGAKIDEVERLLRALRELDGIFDSIASPLVATEAAAEAMDDDESVLTSTGAPE